MSSSTPPADDHARILDYWNRRRHRLSEPEWKDFYRLVVPVLMATHLPSEYDDRKARRDLVDMFFAEKIFLNASSTKAGALTSVHALHLYLKRFALDILRRASHYTTTDELPEQPEPAGEDVETDAAPPVAYAQLLAEAGIRLDDASRSAETFLESLDKGERAYLRHHSCAEEEDKEPISGIARRLAIGTTFHFKAKSLGITRSKGETYVGYEKTKIGKWLLSLGARLSTEWQQELAVLLILLCMKVHELDAGDAA